MAINLYRKLPPHKRYGVSPLGFVQRYSKSGEKYWYLDCLLYLDGIYEGIQSFIMYNYNEKDFENEELENLMVITKQTKTNGYPAFEFVEFDEKIDKQFGIIKSINEQNDLKEYNIRGKYEHTKPNSFAKNEYDEDEYSFYNEFEGLEDGLPDDFDGDFYDAMEYLGHDKD